MDELCTSTDCRAQIDTLASGNAVIKFRKLRKLLRKRGIEWDPDVGKGSHGAFFGDTHQTRVRRVFTLPRGQQTEVSDAYLKSLRRIFELLPEYGVSDSEFFGE